MGQKQKKIQKVSKYRVKRKNWNMGKIQGFRGIWNFKGKIKRLKIKLVRKVDEHGQL